MAEAVDMIEQLTARISNLENVIVRQNEKIVKFERSNKTFNESLNASSSNAGNRIYGVAYPLNVLNTIATVSTPINRSIAIRSHLTTSTPATVQPIVSAATKASTPVTSVKGVKSADATVSTPIIRFIAIRPQLTTRIPSTSVTSVKEVKSADGSILFICQECNRAFKRYKSLKKHKNLFHKDLPIKIHNNIEKFNAFICKYCKRNFKDENFLQRHILKLHPKNVDIETIKNHEKRYFKQEIIDSKTSEFICKICKKGFAKERSVQVHIKIHTNKIIHKCDVCNKDYKYKATLRKHNEKQHGIGQDMYNGTNDPINKERIAVKKSENKHVCPTCHKTFTNKSRLSRHNINDHSRVKKVNCMVPGCSKEFINLSQVRLHLESSEINEGHSFTLEREEKSFNNIKEFDNWKEDIEESDNARYFKKRNATKNKHGSYRTIFHCSRSGKYCLKETRKRCVKSQGSFKIGGYCPSTIEIICDSDGSVHSLYYKTHLGHETTGLSNLRKLSMHKRDKMFIEEKNSQGIETKRIIEDLKKKGGRSSCIQRTEIRKLLNYKNKGRSNKYLHLGGQQLHNETDNEAKNTVENYELNSNLPEICINENNIIVMCQICDKDFVNKSMLTEHMKISHFIEPTNKEDIRKYSTVVTL